MDTALQTGATVAGAVKWAEMRLRDAGVESPRLNAELLLAHILKLRRLELHLDREHALSEAQVARFAACVDRRTEREPLQYIIGAQEFMGLQLEVDSRVLVPRGDTEVLVEQVLDRLERHFFGTVRVIDIGTGSGAIGLAIAHFFPEAEVVLADISIDALLVAARNRERLGLEDRVHIVASDLHTAFHDSYWWGSIDVVTCNLPYIPQDVIPTLQPEVRDYEPRVALDGGPDGLDPWRRLVAELGSGLSERGMLAGEIGIGQSSAAAEIVRANDAFRGVEVIEDYAKIPRVVMAYRPAYAGTDER